MKNLVLIAFSLILSVLTASAKDDRPGRPIEMDTVIQVPGLTQEQIYDGLKVWFANSMNSANHVIQLDDREKAHIIGKANLGFEVNNLTWSQLTGCIHFTIDVQAREGRLRLKLYDYSHESFNKHYGSAWSEGLVCITGKPSNLRSGHGKQYSEMQKRAVPKILEQMANTIASIQVTLSSPEASDNDDW